MLHARQPVGRPAVAAVGCGERLGVRRPGARCGSSSSATSTPRAAAASSPVSGRRQRRPRGRADGGVLVAQQVLGLGRPRQQLGVEQQPVGVQLVPQAAAVGRPSAAGKQLLGERRGEERPAGAGVDGAGLAAGGAEAAARRLRRRGRRARPRASPCASPRRSTRSTPARRTRRTPRPGAPAGRGAPRWRPAPSSAAGTAASAGASANRLITSSAPAAFSSRTVTRPWCAVSTTRLPRTSVMSSWSAVALAGAPPARPATGNGLTGSYQTCSAGTETTSFSG